MSVATASPPKASTREFIRKGQPPTEDYRELLFDLEITESVLKKILTIEINNNNLVIINGTLIFSKKNIENLINDIKKYFTINDTMDIGAFKKVAGTTRKYAVPLLEYFDKCGLTYRQGNLRKLNE